MMNQELPVARERVDRPQVLQRGSVLAAVLILAGIGGVVAGDTPGSLQEMARKADELAATPASRDQAVAGYQALIETHLANADLFDAALRQLARCYLDAGRGEEGIRFFASLGPKIFDPKRGSAFRDIMREFSLKYPEQARAAWDQMMPSSRRETRPAEVVPARDLSAAILQRTDADQREKALARLKAMLAPESPDDSKKQGLATLRLVLTAKFDRQPFRERVLPLLRAQDPDLRALTLRCLPGLEATVDDLARILPLAQDPAPQVRMEVGMALISIGQGKEKEKVIPALTTLLRDPDRNIVEPTLRSMWGQYSSPEFDELLIQVAKRDRECHGWVIYHALSTMRSKGLAVCRRLIEELSDPDWNNSGRAAWGLTYGVVEEAKPLVEDGLLKALPQETNDYTRENELRALHNVGTAKCRPYLQSMIDSPSETDKFKQIARDVLASVERRP
jgi:hypothetical protein